MALNALEVLNEQLLVLFAILGEGTVEHRIALRELFDAPFHKISLLRAHGRHPQGQPGIPAEQLFHPLGDGNTLRLIDLVLERSVLHMAEKQSL